MTVEEFDTIVDTMVVESPNDLIDGEYVTKETTLNQLLDLRNATDDASIIPLIDAALADIPGKNLTHYVWVEEQLGIICGELPMPKPAPQAVTV